jgi:hypothetical protein
VRKLFIQHVGDSPIIIGEMHQLWAGTSESTREMCIAALGIEKGIL